MLLEAVLWVMLQWGSPLAVTLFGRRVSRKSHLVGQDLVRQVKLRFVYISGMLWPPSNSWCRTVLVKPQPTTQFNVDFGLVLMPFIGIYSRRHWYAIDPLVASVAQQPGCLPADSTRHQLGRNVRNLPRHSWETLLSNGCSGNFLTFAFRKREMGFLGAQAKPWAKICFMVVKGRCLSLFGLVLQFGTGKSPWRVGFLRLPSAKWLVVLSAHRGMAMLGER